MGMPTIKSDFIESFDHFSKEIFENAKSKGFKETPKNDGERICLMHAELSEALEAIRKDIKVSEHIPDFSGLEEELADVIIRIMDFSFEKKLKTAQAIIAKMEFNKTRPYKHGNKKF